MIRNNRSYFDQNKKSNYNSDRRSDRKQGNFEEFLNNTEKIKRTGDYELNSLFKSIEEGIKKSDIKHHQLRRIYQTVREYNDKKEILRYRIAYTARNATDKTYTKALINIIDAEIENKINPKENLLKDVVEATIAYAKYHKG